MIIKKESKNIILISLFIFLILSSYTIVLSQDGWTSAGGTSGTGTQSEEKPLTEDQTKAGQNPAQEQGTIQDKNGAEKDGEKQDIGGLTGLPENSESSLKGKNLDFKKETNTEEGTKKVELTENNNLGGESKLELNKNEFSTKDSEGEEKSKFVIEKKDDEKYAETGDGTKYTVGEGEKEGISGKKNAVDELAGREIELTPGSEIEQTKKGNVESVNIKTPNGGEIHQPGDRKNGKEKEGEETKYNWFGNNLNWLDDKGNSHTVNGQLSWDSKNGFYVPKAEQTSIDGVNLFSGGDSNTRLFSDGRTPSKSEAPGPYASFGEKNLVTGSNNNENRGPILEFQKGNRYGVNIDDSGKDNFLMQANPEGQISLTNRNSQSSSNGLSPPPLAEFSKNGGVIQNGNHYYSSNGERYDYGLIKDSKFTDDKGNALKTSSPLEIKGVNNQGGELLNLGNNRHILGDQITNKQGQLVNPGAIVNNNYNYGQPLQYEGNNFDPRVGQNLANSPSPLNNNFNANTNTNIPSTRTEPYTNSQELTNSLNQNQQRNFNTLAQNQKDWVTNDLETLQKQQRFLDLSPTERELFKSSSFEAQKNILSSTNDVHSEIQKNNPINVKYGDFPSGPSRAGYRTQNFEVKGNGDNVQYANAAEYYRKRLAIEFNGEEMPTWGKGVKMQTKTDPNLGSGGATSFIFDKGEVSEWDMRVQGSPERLVDSVIPHEVMHTISASRFREPLPRWIDEGIATTVENTIEKTKYDRQLNEFLKTGRGIEFNQMMNTIDYPKDTLPLYAQGHSATEYLIHLGGGGTQGRQKLYNFMNNAVGVKGTAGDEDWVGALRNDYGLTPSQFQQEWLNDYIKNGYKSRGY